MTIETMQPAPTAQWIGQATAVEQARAVAEVAAAVQVAKMFPRDVSAAEREMKRACSRFEMADRAFYNFKRGGKNVNGPTVYLARELARCFGNMQWGLQEMRRDEAGGLSEMQAFAWDVEHNSRQSTTFVVPHARDVTVDGENVVKPLASLRDVYENNANQGSRRQREMILGLLPQWFVDEAIDLCRAALRRGVGDQTLEQRAAAAVEGFAQAFKVDRGRLERRVGAPVSTWSEDDVADLSIVFRSLQRGETTVAEQFPTSSVTVDDIGTPAPAPAPATPAAPAAAADDASMKRIGQMQWRKIQSRFNELEVTGEGQAAKRRAVMASIVDRDVSSPDDLTVADGDLIIATLAGDGGPRAVHAVLAPSPAADPVADTERAADPVAEHAEATPDAEPAPAPGEYDPTTDRDWPGAEQTPQDWAGEQ